MYTLTAFKTFKKPVSLHSAKQARKVRFGNFRFGNFGLEIRNSRSGFRNSRFGFCSSLPMMKIAGSLKLFALVGHTAPENGMASQAACAEMVKLQSVSGCWHFLCTPLPKIAGRLRRFACK